jgi:hypothetical protein
MASDIDVNVPTPVRATTKSVRENFVAAKDEIEALQLDNAAQDDRLDLLEAGGSVDLTPLEDRITVNESDIADLQADVGQNTTDITDLDGRVGVNEVDIVGLKAQVDTNKDGIKDNK